MPEIKTGLILCHQHEKVDILQRNTACLPYEIFYMNLDSFSTLISKIYDIAVIRPGIPEQNTKLSFSVKIRSKSFSLLR